MTATASGCVAPVPLPPGLDQGDDIQRDTKMKRLLLAGALVVLALPASGQSTRSASLAAYEARAAEFWRLGAQAMAANRCGIRSDRWLTTMDTGIALMLDEKMRQMGLSEAEQMTGRSDSRPIMNKTLATTSCRALVNSETMQVLDSFYSHLTGGYR